MITKHFKKHLLNQIKLASFLWLSPYYWDSKHSLIQRIPVGTRFYISCTQMVIYTAYSVGMTYWMICGDGSADLKLQAMTIVLIFVIFALLGWIWRTDIGPVQLLNSTFNMESDLLRGD